VSIVVDVDDVEEKGRDGVKIGCGGAEDIWYRLRGDI